MSSAGASSWTRWPAPGTRAASSRPFATGIQAAGGTDVLTHQGGVERRRQLFEDAGALTDQPEEQGPPRRRRDRIDQGEGPVAGPVQEVRPQGGGTAEVVGDDERFGQAPVAQELGEDPGERAGDGTPDVRGEGRAAQKGDRRSAGRAQPVPADVT